MKLTLKYITIGILLLSICGCATSGIKVSSTETSIQIEPLESIGFLSWLFGNKLPAGHYRGKIGDKEIEVDTKKDLKLIDINASKIGK